MKTYSQYVNHYQMVVQLLAKRKSDSELQNILESFKPDPRGKGIKDYMIMPIQRIPRYQMLLAVSKLFIVKIIIHKKEIV